MRLFTLPRPSGITKTEHVLETGLFPSSAGVPGRSGMAFHATKEELGPGKHHAMKMYGGVELLLHHS
jgi:hypothetical protein